MLPRWRWGWSTAFRFEHDGQLLVARFGRHAEDFRKDRRAATLYGSCIPVPQVLEIGEAFDGHVYAISEWANGEVIDGLPEPHLRAALPSLLDTLDALRAAPPPTETGFGWWSSRGRAMHDTWRDALLGIVEDEENSRLAGWRAFLRATPNGRGASTTRRPGSRSLPMLAQRCSPRNPRRLAAGTYSLPTEGSPQSSTGETRSSGTRSMTWPGSCSGRPGTQDWTPTSSSPRPDVAAPRRVSTSRTSTSGSAVANSISPSTRWPTTPSAGTRGT